MTARGPGRLFSDRPDGRRSCAHRQKPDPERQPLFAAAFSWRFWLWGPSTALGKTTSFARSPGSVATGPRHRPPTDVLLPTAPTTPLVQTPGRLGTRPEPGSIRIPANRAVSVANAVTTVAGAHAGRAPARGLRASVASVSVYRIASAVRAETMAAEALAERVREGRAAGKDSAPEATGPRFG